MAAVRKGKMTVVIQLVVGERHIKDGTQQLSQLSQSQLSTNLSTSHQHIVYSFLMNLYLYFKIEKGNKPKMTKYKKKTIINAIQL